MLTFKPLQLSDIHLLATGYVQYFNIEEQATWTIKTASRKLDQLINRIDMIGFILYQDETIIGFSIGQLIQFDDGIVFELNEILIYKQFQNQGYGSLLLEKMEKEAIQNGAFRVQLFSINDDEHHHFYNLKHKYQDASNMLWKTKAL